MLHVSIHAGPIDAVSRYNRLAWLDIGYEKLAAVADYKTVLFQSGIGATMPAPLYGYPRWSATLWDLTARAIALGLRPDLDCLTEEVPPILRTKKRFAFANQVCAIIEHAPASGQYRKTLAMADITQAGRTRGTYIARFEEHTMARHVSEPFEYRPDYLSAAELLLHACLVRLTGKSELPPRPDLCVPPDLEVNGKAYVAIHRLVEPAKTGFTSWLHYNGAPPLNHAGAPLGIAAESLYTRFLKEAI